MKRVFLITMISCVLFNMVSLADTKKESKETFYFFRQLSDCGDGGSLVFYAELMTEDLAIKKSKLWLEAQKEMVRLAKICPEPETDDPQDFMLWRDRFYKKHAKLDRILDKFYAIKGRLVRLETSGDEISRISILNSEFGDIVSSSVVDKELIDFFDGGAGRVYHCNFIRFKIVEIE